MSSSSEQNRIIKVQGGESRKHLSEKITARLVFDDFASLHHEVGDSEDSPTINCHGREWMVSINPGGVDEEDAGYVGLFLHLVGEDRNIKTKFSLRIPAANKSWTGVRDFKGTPDMYGYGKQTYCTREEALNSLDEDGALVVYVDIQIYTNAAPKWTPKETLREDISKLFQVSKFKDVTFSVGGTLFEAHRNILSVRAPALAALAEDVSPGTTIEIKDIDASVFEYFLHFVYNDEPPSNLATHALELLEVADRFDCKRLKFLVESELETTLDSDNAADLLLLADRKNCALLKESAIYLIAEKHKEVRTSSGWAKLAESASLLDIIMIAIGEQDQTGDTEEDDSDFSKMRVGKLRSMLEERGLDVDGSREVLIQRLEQQESTEGTDESRAPKRRRTE